MSRLFRRVWALMLCSVLAQAAWPARASMACIVATGRILDICPPGGHRRALPSPAPSLKPCCRPQAVSVDSGTGSHMTDGGVRCATVSVAKNVPTVDLALFSIGTDLPLLAPPPAFRATTAKVAIDSEGTFPDDADPPPSQPYSPDLGRAPPIL